MGGAHMEWRHAVLSPRALSDSMQCPPFIFSSLTCSEVRGDNKPAILPLMPILGARLSCFSGQDDHTG
jgi:hypothetical protein